MGDAIGSGHAPYCRATKEQLRSEAAIGPARVHGVVGKGRLAAGHDADFTLMDMRRTRASRKAGSPRPAAGRRSRGCRWPVGRWPVVSHRPRAMVPPLRHPPICT